VRVGVWFGPWECAGKSPADLTSTVSNTSTRRGRVGSAPAAPWARAGANVLRGRDSVGDYPTTSTRMRVQRGGFWILDDSTSSPGWNVFLKKITQYIENTHNARTLNYIYEYMHVNHTLMSIFENCAGKSSRLTKSPQTLHCRRERRLPLKAQTSLNSEKFAPTGNRTQDLRCYRSSCNH
jgi:hypothetical protein